MSTRLYFRLTEAPDISPTIDAGWDESNSLARRVLAREPLAGDTITSTGVSTATSGAAVDEIHRQLISDPMAAGNVFDTTVSHRVVIYGEESATNDNVFNSSGIRIVSEDGSTVRHTVRSVGYNGAGGSDTEWLTTASPRYQMVNQVGAGSYTTVDGDRLVVELGHRVKSGTTPQGTMWWGSDEAATDIPIGSSSTTADKPWYETSLDIIWQGEEPEDPPAPPAATPSPANFRPIVPAGGFGARTEWPAINPEPSSFQDFAFVPTGSIRDDHISDVSATKLRLFGAKAYRSTTQAIADDGTFQAVSFDTEEYDLGDFWASGSATRLTCRLDGVYVIDGYAEFEANATGVRRAQIRLNGANQMKLLAIASPGAGISAGLPLTWTGRLTAGDYVEFLVRQNSGGNLNVQSGAANNYLAASYQGRI